MTLGVDVRERTAPPAKGAPTDTGTLFLAAKPGGAAQTTAVGPLTSLADLTDEFGARGVADTTNEPLYDYLDGFFSEGGARAYVGAYTTDYGAGLDMFDKRLGPGQLAAIDVAPGATLFSDLTDVASTTNRVVLADVAGDDDTIAAMEAVGDLLPDDQAGERIGLFGSWVTIPGPRGISGVGVRHIPGSAIIAALCNRVDQNGNPNRAAAGLDYPLQYTRDLVYDPTEDEREGALNNHAVNTFADFYTVLCNFGFQTPIPTSEETPFDQLNAARARMWLKAQAQALAAPFAFRNIDAEGHLQGALASALSIPCKALYDADGLYGATADEAYKISTGVTINTAATAAKAEVHAVVQAKFSRSAKAVIVELVSVPVTGTIV